MRPRVGQRPDHPDELQHRAGPAVQQQQRQRARLGRADVQEVDVLSVNGGGELRDLVEPGLVCAPVVPAAPALGQPLHHAQRHPVVSARPAHLIRPPGGGQSLGESVEVGLRDVDTERCDLRCRRHTPDATEPSGQLLS
jgi:hypothetical protein